MIGFSFVNFSCVEKIDKSVSRNDYKDLIDLFREFREFQTPTVVNGIPDFTERAMNEQYVGLKLLQDKLATIDTTGHATNNILS